MKANKAFKLKLFQFFIANLLIVASLQAQLHADFSANITSGCSPIVVHFQDNSTGNPVQWKWDLGNGTTSTLQNPSVSYILPGTFNVKLVIKNAAGNADSIVKSQFIIVFDNPVVNFSANPLTGCYPLKVQFTDVSTIASNSGTISQWQWDFGNGNVSTQQNPNHTYLSMGNFDIKLKVTTDKGCFKILNKPAYIKIGGGVKSSFTYTTTGTCQPPTPVTFTNTSSGTGTLSYVWWFGDGTSSTATNPTHVYSTTGSYTVTLITTNSTGCSDTIVKTNAVNVGAVQANFTKPDTACAGASINFINTSTPSAVAANWYFSDGTTSTQISPVKKFNIAGTYQIKLVNSFGVCSDSITKSIVILPKPIASFTSTNNLSCAAPVTVQFNNTSTAATSYMWSFGDGNTSTIQHPTNAYNSIGSYTTTLIVTASNGCTDTVTKSNFVQIAAPKIDSIHIDQDKGCVPLTTSFLGHISSVQGISQYSWSFGDGGTSNAANPTHIYTSEGKFTVTLTITTVGGCTTTYTLTDGILVGHKPVAAFTAVPQNVCAETSVSFTDASTGGPIDHWEWHFGDGSKKFIQNPTHKYTDTGYFNVKLIVTNNGCNDTLIKPRYVHIMPPIAKFVFAYGDCGNKLKINFTDSSIGAINYLWDFGDGTTSTQQNPVHVYPATGTYNVSLTVTNGICSYKREKNVWVDGSNGIFKADKYEGCNNLPIKLYVDSINAAISANFIFYPGDGSVNSVTNNEYTHIYTNPGTYNAFVIVTYSNGCRDTLYLNTSIKIYGPKAKFNAQNPEYCVGSTVNFIDSSLTDGTHNITNWTWDYGDSTIINYTAAPFTHTYTKPSNYNVKLIVKDSYGCLDSVFNTVNIYQAVAKFAESDTLVCPNTVVNFFNNSTGNNLSNNWDFGDGTTSTQINPTHSYTQQGVYTVKLAVADNFGCADALIKVNRIKVYYPVANFSLSDSFAVCPPLLVNITNNSLNAGTTSWTFGDGSSSSNIAPSHLYVYPGNYIVKLIVTNVGGCADSAFKTVSINGPTGTFSYTPTIGCTPLKVNFTSVTQNSINNTWDYNNGVTYATAGNTATHTYTQMGNYLPKLILEDAQGCKVPIVGPDSIKVKDILAFIAVPQKTVCDSAYINFYDSSITNDSIVSFLWNFGDGTTSTQPKPTHLYNQNGWYNVSLSVVTQAGCSSSVTVNQNVKVVPTPKAQINSDTSICKFGLITFTATLLNPDTSFVNWKWQFGNGNTATVQNPPAQPYNTGGIYNIQNIVQSTNGCSDTSYRKITVHELPIVDAGVDTFVCRNKAYNLLATGALTYTWVANSTLSCTNCPNPIAKPLADIMYKVTGKDAHNCIATDSVYITVQQPQKISVSKNDTICLGQTSVLKAMGTETYAWYPTTFVNNATLPTVLIKPTIDTVINYMVIGGDKRNCFKDTGYVKVKAYPIPKFDINLSEVTINAGSTIKIATTSSSDVTKWKWTPNKYLDNPNAPQPTATGKENITYLCIASNEGKCTAQDEIKVIVLCNGTNVYLPNTFSPNNDGANDVFYPRGKGLFNIKSLRVFNRWGEVVFERNNFMANDASAGWDGTYKGIKLPTDAYVYAIDVICDNNAIVPVKGSITLLR